MNAIATITHNKYKNKLQMYDFYMLHIHHCRRRESHRHRRGNGSGGRSKIYGFLCRDDDGVGKKENRTIIV